MGLFDILDGYNVLNFKKTCVIPDAEPDYQDKKYMIWLTESSIVVCSLYFHRKLSNSRIRFMNQQIVFDKPRVAICYLKDITTYKPYSSFSIELISANGKRYRSSEATAVRRLKIALDRAAKLQDLHPKVLGAGSLGYYESNGNLWVLTGAIKRKPIAREIISMRQFYKLPNWHELIGDLPSL